MVPFFTYKLTHKSAREIFAEIRKIIVTKLREIILNFVLISYFAK
jgi:hypothetical protein